MTRSAAELLAEAKTLEGRLERQQKSVAASQKELDAALRRQVALVERREEHERSVEAERQAKRVRDLRRAASLPRWIVRTLGFVPILLVVIAVFGISRSTALFVGITLGVVQLLAFARYRSQGRDDGPSVTH